MTSVQTDLTSPENQPCAAPLISVVICTHNRAEYLRTAIESVLNQDFAQSFELIVIDNKSTDETAAVCASFQPDPRLRYLFEGQLGLCYARNRGWREAGGVYIAYMDDDAIAEPEWLQATVAAFEFDANAGVVGGRVDPIWYAERPQWVSDSVSTCLTVIDWGPVPKLIPDVRAEWLAGVNMAIPAKVLAEIGGFDPRLDRIGTNMLSGGDVFLQQKILEHGYSCVYHPGMAVRHVVPKSRLEKRWFSRRYYWQGISDAVMELIVDRPGRLERIGRGLRRAAGLLKRPGVLIELLRPTDDAQRFQQQCFTLIEVGHVMGLLGVARA